jgi:hypothetical protein
MNIGYERLSKKRINVATCECDNGISYQRYDGTIEYCYHLQIRCLGLIYFEKIHSKRCLTI